MDRILNRNFEADTDWVLTPVSGTVFAYSTDDARSGTRSVEARGTLGGAGSTILGYLDQTLVTGNAVDVPVSIHIKADDASDTTGHLVVKCYWYDKTSTPQLLGTVTYTHGVTRPVGFQLTDFGSFTADGPTNKVRFEISMVDLTGGILPIWLYLDDAASAVYVARSSVLAFMDQLKAYMRGVDDNLGAIFTSNKRWMGLKALKDASTMTLDTSGIIDDIARIGANVTRFWVMSPQIKSKQLTNESLEYENIIEITGFFQREANDTQEEALNTALTELVGALSTRDAQFGALHTTENGYLGYLDFPPIIYLPVRNAILAESTVQGHAGQIQMRYFEEVVQ